MTVTVAKFRGDFTEFADPTKYPDALVTFWLTVAGNLITNTQLDNMTDLLVELFIAHNIALEGKAVEDSSVGNIPGLSTGPVSSVSVDKVSESYAAEGALEEKAGHWNLTVYGTRYIRVIRMFGAGGAVC